LAKKIDRKDLKQPDEFISFSHKALQWALERRTGVLVGIAALVLIIIGFYAWRWYLHENARHASMDFIEAKKILETSLQESPNQQPTNMSQASYVTEKEKHQAAIEAFKKVKNNHKGTDVASLATYFIAESNRKIGEYANAIKYFKEYISEQGQNGLLGVFALEGIATSHESQDKPEEALKHYQKLEKLEPDRGKYHQARLKQKSGEIQEARRLYEDIIKEHPQTIYRQTIEERLSQLTIEEKTTPESTQDINPKSKTEPTSSPPNPEQPPSPQTPKSEPKSGEGVD